MAIVLLFTNTMFNGQFFVTGFRSLSILFIAPDPAHGTKGIQINMHN